MPKQKQTTGHEGMRFAQCGGRDDEEKNDGRSPITRWLKHQVQTRRRRQARAEIRATLAAPETQEG